MSPRSYEVMLYGGAVGWLSEAADGRIGFRFSDFYRYFPQRPVVSQFFEDDLERTYFGKQPERLPAFFWNLLPEGRLRSLQEQALQLTPGDDLALLAATCRDLPGALLLSPCSEMPELDPRHDESPEICPPLADRPEALGLRFSLAGVQLKFSLISREDRFNLPARDEHGDWIVKIPSAEYPGLSENEHAMLDWAQAAGFEVPAHRLCTAEQLGPLGNHLPAGTRAFAIRRYDRLEPAPPAGPSAAPSEVTLPSDKNVPKRLHQEDFAQVLGFVPERKYDFSYDGLAALARGLGGEPMYEEFIKRLVFVVACGNQDAHLKNWSLLYRDAITPSWSPIYDQVATVVYPALDRKLALKLAALRDFGRIDLTAFRRLAKKAGADPERTARIASDFLSHLRAAWHKEQPARVLAERAVEALREHWQRVPLLREAGPLAAG